jgi:DNA-binding response OmpR family regulator/two-component sensor histidine kinase
VSKNVKEELSEKLGLIKRNGDRLLNLVNRILDLAKLESGSLALNLKNGNIISYLNYLVHSFHSYAQSKDIHIKFLTELDHLDMDYDEEKIQQIITNLLSNAIKFTPEGGQIKVLLKHLKDSNQLYISVKDSGIGIGKEDLTHVFERFYQTKEITKRANEGSGIGLSLVNELIELMSGKIKAKSEIGKGTEFELWLPIDNQQSPIDNSQPTVLVDNQELNSNLGNTGLQTKSIDNSKSPFKERTKATLLIIEDSPDIIQYLKTILQNDYEILTAFNGAMGIETAIENVPDIIISDVMMPEKDGFEVCEALKNDERTSHIPIILLTAKATVKDKIAGLTRGADAYLAKPFEKEELFIRLEKLVDLRKKLKIRYSNFHKEEVLNISTKPDPFIHTEMEDAFLLKLKKLMEDNLNDSDFGIPQICRGMAMSRAQLHRKITALTGKSTSIFIRSLRLHHAKKLLLTTDLNISEVAYDVGFKDPNYFSRTYAEEFGETPSETRN